LIRTSKARFGGPSFFGLGLTSPLYLEPQARVGSVVSFNTDATHDVPILSTRRLDAEIREFFEAHVAMGLDAANPKPFPAVKH